MKKINLFFKLSKNNSNFKIEILAGITSFLAMAYILTVNPYNILQNGTLDPRFSSVFIATALASFLASLMFGLIAKVPFSSAPGMGVNAILGSLLAGTLGCKFTYSNIMILVFISGLITLLISVIPLKNGITIREKIFDSIPKIIRLSIPIGIGLFIIFIGLENSHIISFSNNTFKVINLTNIEIWKSEYFKEALICLISLFSIILLSKKKVKSPIILGILISTLIAIPLKVVNLDILMGNVSGISWNILNNLKDFFNVNSKNSVFLAIYNNGVFPNGSLLTCFMLVLTLVMIDIFNTMGSCIACLENTNLLDRNGKPKNYSKIMLVDSFSAIASSLIGVNKTTIYVESKTGIMEGGRTGLTSLITAILFLLSIFLLPIFAFIPISAISGVLIYVGLLMFKNISKLNLKSIKNIIISFVTIFSMVFFYKSTNGSSITDGIGLGLITFVLIDLITYFINFLKSIKDKRYKPKLETNLITFIILILFLIYFIVPIII